MDREVLMETNDENSAPDQLKEAVAELQQQARMGVGRTTGQNEGRTQAFHILEPNKVLEAQMDPLQGSSHFSIGRTLQEDLRACLRSTPATSRVREDAGTDVSYQIATYLRSLACSDPGVFKGGKNENFNEFVRRFKRKYEDVITCEATLIDVMGDDHLGGRAKNIFATLPRFIKEQGFEAVTAEMAKLLSSDTVAGRMRALTELRNLRLRPNQDVADFCTVLEKLGRQANPGCTIGDRSMEYAQILLDNLSHWPEHFQLLGALHKVEPNRAYEEIKELALSIEQSKLMFGEQRKLVVPTWKRRASHYFEQGRFDRTEEQPRRYAGDPARVETPRQVVQPHHNRARGMVNDSQRMNSSAQTQVRDGTNGARGGDNRKCYNCAKYGHIGRDCPKRATRVNQLECDQSEPTDSTTLSTIIRQVRSLGLVVRDKTHDDLVGDRMVVPLRTLGEELPALIDTGSMISIVPIEVLARAQDRGVDVDALKLVDRSVLKPVFDASNNEMKFLGAVYLQIELEGGNRSTVAFYISPGKENELLIGTNALGSLGVSVTIAKRGNCSSDPFSPEEQNRGVVAVVSRTIIPPHESAIVEVECKGETFPKVGDRVYVLSPSKKARNTHPKLINEWSGPYRVIEVSDNSALITRIGENNDPVRIQFDQLRIVPKSIGDERIDTEHARGRRGRKPKIKVNKMYVNNFRGVRLSSAEEKGHLQYQCLDDCFAGTTLGDIKGVDFPGAYARQPFSDVWTAWRTTSIFIRTDLSTARKIKLHKERAVCLDAEALFRILMLCYEVCTEWTEFICTTNEIEKHSPIENNCVEDFYRIAFARAKEEIAQEAKKDRVPKVGPIGFAAPDSAHLLEKDGPRDGLHTRVVTSFEKLRDVLQDWVSFGTWIVVYPLEAKGDRIVIEDVIKLMKQHLEAGGRLITAWTPIMEMKRDKWIAMHQLWMTVDTIVKKFANSDQLVLTACSKLIDGRVFSEVGSPETSFQYYFTYPGVAAAKHLYEVIRKRAPKICLPQIRQERSTRTSTLKRGGMSAHDVDHLDQPGRPPLKRLAP